MSDRPEIGNVLRSAREEYGWSLDDVAHRTRIPVATLRGLEEDDYAGFSSLAYAKSFLGQYSDYLGVDATDWLDSFETGDVFENLDSYGYLKDHDEHVGEDTALPVRPKRKASKEPAHAAAPTPAPARIKSGNGLQPLLIFSVTAALITGAVFGVIHFSEKFGEATGEKEAAEEALSVDNEADLRPLSSIPDARPATLDTTNIPRAVTVISDPDPDQPVESVATDPVTCFRIPGTDGGGLETANGVQAAKVEVFIDRQFAVFIFKSLSG